jgi:hypothetical protein
MLISGRRRAYETRGSETLAEEYVFWRHEVMSRKTCATVVQGRLSGLLKNPDASLKSIHFSSQPFCCVGNPWCNQSCLSCMVLQGCFRFLPSMRAARFFPPAGKPRDSKDGMDQGQHWMAEPCLTPLPSLGGPPAPGYACLRSSGSTVWP